MLNVVDINNTCHTPYLRIELSCTYSCQCCVVDGTRFCALRRYTPGGGPTSIETCSALLNELFPSQSCYQAPTISAATNKYAFIQIKFTSCINERFTVVDIYDIIPDYGSSLSG